MKDSVKLSLQQKGLILALIALVFFTLGWVLSRSAHAADKRPQGTAGAKVVYPKKSEVDFEGMAIQGEIRSPGEFYFQRRPEEKFDSLVKRRKNFHKEMLRDVVMSR